MTMPRLSRSATQEAVAGGGDRARLHRLRDCSPTGSPISTTCATSLLQAAPTVIATVGMTFVIATRGIDLSIGSILNLALCTAVTLTGTRIEAELSTQTTALVYPVASGDGADPRRHQRAAHHPPAAEPAHRHVWAR